MAEPFAIYSQWEAVNLSTFLCSLYISFLKLLGPTDVTLRQAPFFLETTTLPLLCLLATLSEEKKWQFGLEKNSNKQNLEIFGNTAIIQPFFKMCYRKDCFQNLKY